MSLQFGEFELDRERRQLLRSGRPLPLEPKAYELLSLLVERRPKALSRAQIRDVVWPGVFISESTLGVAVNAIRQALGDDARQPRFIRTVHGFGYAFCGEVTGEEAVSGEEEARPAETRGPYPGLSSFTEEDAEIFFGREVEVQALWERLQRRRLLALIGPSGAGKTSFVRAGVIPARPAGWRAIVSIPGRAPMTGLARALTPEVAGDAAAVEELLGFEDPEVAFRALRRWRQGQDRVLLVVDQFEELFTLNPAETQARFAELLGRLSDDADVHVLLSLRDDFLIRCHDHEALGPVFTADLTPLVALRGDGLRRALVEPAKREDYAFEDDSLVEEMVGAVKGERGALPLLAFAVSRLWEKRDRDGKLLTQAAYEEIGGVAGALAQHAEQTLERIGPTREPIVRELFRNLVTAQQTRAAADREELLSVLPDPDTGAPVLDELIDARLLTSYEIRDAASHPERGIVESRAKDLMPELPAPPRTTHRIEIVHESLLRAWPRLVRWQAQDEEGALLRDQLKQAAHLWEEKGRPDDLLWTGTSEREFELWRDRYPGKLTSVEEKFARSMVDRAQRRRRRRRLAVAGVVAGSLAVAAIVSLSRQQAVEQTHRAEAAALRAEAGRLLALGQIELEANPTAALAYTTKSLELADTEEARQLALRVLQRGPTALVLPDSQREWYPYFAFSPNGERLARGDFPTTLLYRRDGGAAVGSCQGSTSYRWAEYAFGSDGRLLVGNRSGDVRIWSVPDGRKVRRLEVEDSVFFARGQGFFTSASVGGREIVRWTALAEGGPRLVGTTDAAAIKDVDAAGRWLAYVPGSYAFGRRLYLRSLEDWSSPPRVVGTHPAGIVDVAFHPDSRHIAAGDTSGKIRIWEAEASSERGPRVLDCAGVIDLAYSPRGRWLAAIGAGETTAYAKLWDLEAPASIEPLSFPVEDLHVGSWTFDPSERWLAKPSLLGTAFWPLAETYSRSVGRHDWFVDDVAFTPDGSTLVSVSGSPEGTVRARSVSTNDTGSERVLLRTTISSRPGLAVDPRGERVAVSGWGPTAVFVVPLSGGPPRELRGFSAEVWVCAIAFSPDGRRVAAAALDGPAEHKVIQIWDLEDGGEDILGPLPGAGDEQAGGVESLQFVDDDRLVSSGTSGVHLFDRRAGGHRPLSHRPGRGMAVDRRNEAVFALLGEPEEIVRLGLDGAEPTRIAPCVGCLSLDADPTGTLIATLGADGVVRIVSASGGEPHLFFGRASPAGQMVAFSPDGRWVASSGERDHVRLWPVPDVTRVPFHRRPHDEVLATLRSWTNLRAVKDPQSPTGWKLELGPFPGWEEVPTW